MSHSSSMSVVEPLHPAPALHVEHELPESRHVEEQPLGHVEPVGLPDDARPVVHAVAVLGHPRVDHEAGGRAGGGRRAHDGLHGEVAADLDRGRHRPEQHDHVGGLETALRLEAAGRLAGRRRPPRGRPIGQRSR